jgi:hypothetical protein
MVMEKVLPAQMTDIFRLMMKLRLLNPSWRKQAAFTWLVIRMEDA